jgi:hypothetical protein
MVGISYIIFIVYQYTRNPKKMAGYAFLLPGHVYNILSLILIESGGWILEQRCFGHENGSTLLYVFYLGFIFIGYQACFILFPRLMLFSYIRKEVVPSNQAHWRAILGTLSLYILIFGFAQYRAQGVDGATRFNTLVLTYPKWSIFFMSVSFNAVAWYGLLRINGFGRKVAIAACYLIGSILVGGSSSTFINIALLFIASIGLDSALSNQKGRLLVMFSFVFVFAVIFKISYEYYTKQYESDQIDLAIDFVKLRLVEQAHLFWFATERFLNDSLVDIGFINFVGNFFQLSYTMSSEYGLGRLMYHVDSNIAQVFFEEGISMSAGFPAIVLASSGFFFTAFVCFLMGIAYCVMTSFMIHVAKNHSFPLFLLAFYCFNQMCNIIMNGDFGFINFKIMIYFTVMILMYNYGRDLLFVGRQVQNK